MRDTIDMACMVHRTKHSFTQCFGYCYYTTDDDGDDIDTIVAVHSIVPKCKTDNGIISIFPVVQHYYHNTQFRCSTLRSLSFANVVCVCVFLLLRDSFFATEQALRFD